MATTIPESVTTIPAGTLRLLLTSIRYWAKARKEMRRKPPMVPRRRARKKAQCQANARSGKHRDPAGLAWYAVCCTVWHGSITGYNGAPYIHYYNRRYALTCTASGVALVSGMRWRCCGAVIRSSIAQAVLYPLLPVWYCMR